MYDLLIISQLVDVNLVKDLILVVLLCLLIYRTQVIRFDRSRQADYDINKKGSFHAGGAKRIGSVFW